MADEQKQLLEQIELLLESGDMPALSELLNDERSSDIAAIVELVGNEERRAIFDVMDKSMSAEVLEKVDEATRAELFELLKVEEMISLVSELDPDDATDILSELSEEERAGLLESISPTESAEIKELMSYSEDSAGGIMDPVIISVSEGATVGEAVSKIRTAEIDEDFYSVYVVSKTGRFLGDHGRHDSWFVSAFFVPPNRHKPGNQLRSAGHNRKRLDKCGNLYVPDSDAGFMIAGGKYCCQP